jgi:hypothetical protein
VVETIAGLRREHRSGAEFRLILTRAGESDFNRDGVEPPRLDSAWGETGPKQTPVEDWRLAGHSHRAPTPDPVVRPRDDTGNVSDNTNFQLHIWTLSSGRRLCLPALEIGRQGRLPLQPRIVQTPRGVGINTGKSDDYTLQSDNDRLRWGDYGLGSRHYTLDL